MPRTCQSCGKPEDTTRRIIAGTGMCTDCRRLTPFSTDLIGTIMVREALIKIEDLTRAQAEAKRTGKRVGEIVSEMNLVPDDALRDFLHRHYDVPTIKLADITIEQRVIDLVPKDLATKNLIIPVSLSGNTLFVAMVNPNDLMVQDDLARLTSFKIERIVVTEREMKIALKKYYEGHGDAYEEALRDVDAELEVDLTEDEPTAPTLDLTRQADEPPIVRLVNGLLVAALRQRASDIHIEPFERRTRVRFRIDGVLIEQQAIPMKHRAAVISRLKVMANLKIDERRMPQDGRIKFRAIRGTDNVVEIDFRVSVLPSLFGEKVVLRLLDKSNLQLDMTKLGFAEKDLEQFLNAIHEPLGLVLVTGPTGSGKTTTLYSGLAALNDVGRNVSTAEDPIEYTLDGITQVAVLEEIGRTFAHILRSFLRQDPDVIMVGEIRDYETAEVAVKAALTGHLVLSTLHTNDAASTITRLVDMGLQPYLVATSVRLVLAQRLVRRICPECKTPAEQNPAWLVKQGLTENDAANVRLFKGKGCDNCNDTGYRGRVALYEIMVISEQLRRLINQGATADELRAGAVKEGMQTLRQAGIAKIKEGVTTIEEVERVTIID